MVEERTFRRQLEGSLGRLVPRSWRWKLLHARGEEDARLALAAPTGERYEVLVGFRRRAFPAELVDRLTRMSEGSWLLVAPGIGPRGRQLLDDAGISWLEPNGDCRIAVGGLYIERLVGKDRREPRPPGRRYVADLYSGGALRIVRHLLIDPERGWKVAEMADAAKVTPAFVSRTFATLEQAAFVERGRGATRAADPDALLEAWAQAAPAAEERFQFVSLEAGILRRLGGEEAGSGSVDAPDYALTAEVAAEQIAPFAGWTTIEMYVREPERWDERLALEPVPRGGNVVLIASSDRGIFDGAFASQGLVLASRPQVYVDLRRRGGAAEEAAAFLKRRGDLWK